MTTTQDSPRPITEEMGPGAKETTVRGSDAHGSDGDRAEPAKYVTGRHAQEAINAARSAAGQPPADAYCLDLAEVLGGSGAAIVGAAYATFHMGFDAFLDEAEWLPVGALVDAAPGFTPSRAEVARWCSEHGQRDPHDVHAEWTQEEADKAVGGAPDTGMHLPPEFWERRGFLRHIRDAAWERAESPHGALLAVLALLSAYVDPSVRVETGIKSPLPLNMFVGLVSTSGGDKSSAYAFGKRLLRVTLPDPLAAGAIAADEIPLFLGMGSGPGVAEAYMDTVTIPAAESATGKAEKVRRQVRHKLFLHRDEGGEMLAAMRYSSSSLAPVLRSAWSGELEGQANAGKESFRSVEDCALGVAVGFQREVLAQLLTDAEVENGTPQRFLFGSVLDPHAPDIDTVPDNPGPLEVGPLPVGEMRLCGELQRAVRIADLARRRGESVRGRFESQRPAMVARTAALLAILDTLSPAPGRPWDGTVSADDWALAETLFAASVAVQEDAAEWAAELEADKAEKRAAAARDAAVATATAVDERAATLERLRNRILGYLPGAGVAVLWSGREGIRKKKFKSSERQLATVALDALAAAGTVAFDGDKVTRI